MSEKIPSYEVVEILPKDFFSKDINEPFIQKVMAAVLDEVEWKKGDPNCFEPDYFCGGTPFEFTLASDNKRKNNFIQRFQRGTFTSDNVEEDLFGYIEARIADKARKHYSVENVHLCVLCLLEMFDWVSDEYGSYTHPIADYPRECFFSRIKQQYIDTHTFSNIFLIVPDMGAKWWVFDVLTSRKVSVLLTDDEIRSQQYPFVMIKDVYDKLVAESVI